MALATHKDHLQFCKLQGDMNDIRNAGTLSIPWTAWGSILFFNFQHVYFFSRSWGPFAPRKYLYFSSTLVVLFLWLPSIPSNPYIDIHYLSVFLQTAIACFPYLLDLLLLFDFSDLSTQTSPEITHDGDGCSFSRLHQLSFHLSTVEKLRIS